MQQIPDKETLTQIADLFKGFADPTRVHILSLLMAREDLCVTELAEAVGVSQSGVSHQLRLLKQARLVKTRRDGKVRYYSLADEHIQEMFKVAFEHIMEE